MNINNIGIGIGIGFFTMFLLFILYLLIETWVDNRVYAVLKDKEEYERYRRTFK
jgi:hypothetical protein